ncbi:Histone deacetylase [Heracleum sosnowskyi]|uniref:Histone deacetylase n=1 Tax=Heracleum sosnowskyi TaxID=360622 RepID=A0AAD8JMF1_9APIA|nr:Histone deacetylase [Heracleum sosnowskyi]KAK1405211.1 Histone deacetylase [Heracleum sosnowskyi]
MGHRRYEHGFYPHSDDRSFEKIGKGRGLGFNINVPLPGKGADNADYLVVWEHILIPVARKYKPNLVIISADFDAATDDPLGGFRINSKDFGHLLSKLKEFAEGKILMVLEGGYNVKYIPDCALACVEELLKDPKISPLAISIGKESHEKAAESAVAE